MTFSEAHLGGLCPGTLVSSPPSSINGFSQRNAAEVDVILALSIPELSSCTMCT